MPWKKQSSSCFIKKLRLRPKLMLQRPWSRGKTVLILTSGHIYDKKKHQIGISCWMLWDSFCNLSQPCLSLEPGSSTQTAYVTQQLDYVQDVENPNSWLWSLLPDLLLFRLPSWHKVTSFFQGLNWSHTELFLVPSSHIQTIYQSYEFNLWHLSQMHVDVKEWQAGTSGGACL